MNFLKSIGTFFIEFFVNSDYVNGRLEAEWAIDEHGIVGVGELLKTATGERRRGMLSVMNEYTEGVR